MAAFEADVTEALMPFIDRTFRTIPDPITGRWPTCRWEGRRRPTSR